MPFTRSLPLCYYLDWNTMWPWRLAGTDFCNLHSQISQLIRSANSKLRFVRSNFKSRPKLYICNGVLDNNITVRINACDNICEPLCFPDNFQWNNTASDTFKCVNQKGSVRENLFMIYGKKRKKSHFGILKKRKITNANHRSKEVIT